MLRITQLDSCGDYLCTLKGTSFQNLLGKMIQLWRGSFFRLRWEMAPLGVSCILLGNILISCRGILRLPGMLAEEYLYTLLGNIKIFWRYPTFPGLMVDQLCSGESIAELLGILFLFRADGRPTLLGERVLLNLVLLCGE